MVKKKGKSKRISLKDKYKIQRRVVESHRKSRKQAKRDSKAGIVRHGKKKDPGIPNTWPFKQELLLNIKRQKDRMESRRAEEKEQRQRIQRERGGGVADLTELGAQADRERTEFVARDVPDHDLRDVAPSYGQQSRRAYLRSLKQVIESSDCILQVLDARDPVSTCCCSWHSYSLCIWIDLRWIELISAGNGHANTFPNIGFSYDVLDVRMVGLDPSEFECFFSWKPLPFKRRVSSQLPHPQSDEVILFLFHQQGNLILHGVECFRDLTGAGLGFAFVV